MDREHARDLVTKLEIANHGKNLKLLPIFPDRKAEGHQKTSDEWKRIGGKQGRGDKIVSKQRHPFIDR
jgi:hypothetical protein